MAFDVEGARSAGYSDAEIADHLATTSKFNTKQARSAGYSDSEIINHLVSGRTDQKATKLEGADVPGLAETLMIGAGKTFTRVGQGLKQAKLKLTPGDTSKEEAALKAQVDDENRLYEPLAEARPIATSIGESLPSMVVSGGAGPGAGALKTLGSLALAGGVPAALEYGSAGERATRGAMGAAGNMIGGYVVPKALGTIKDLGTAGVQRMIVGKPSQEVMDMATKAESLGIPVSAAQLSEGKFPKTVASQLEQMPFTGARKTHEAQQKTFTRAVAKTFGEDTDKITPEVYASAKKRIGQSFEDISARNNLQVTPQLAQKLGDISHEAAQFAGADSSKAVTNFIDELMGKMDPNTGLVAGKAYQSLDSRMGKIMKGGGEKATFLGSLQESIRDAMDASISQTDKKAWETARSEYKNLKAVRDIVAKADADGQISPGLLMGRVGATGAGKETMAQGTRGELGDLARIGKQFVADRVPNSGTVPRLMAQGLIGGGILGGGLAAGADPSTIAGLAIAGGTSGRMMNNLLNKQMKKITLAELAQASGPATQRLGGMTGMTIADLMQGAKQ